MHDYGKFGYAPRGWEHASQQEPVLMKPRDPNEQDDGTLWSYLKSEVNTKWERAMVIGWVIGMILLIAVLIAL